MARKKSKEKKELKKRIKRRPQNSNEVFFVTNFIICQISIRQLDRSYPVYDKS
jgi:hypothetical protein